MNLWKRKGMAWLALCLMAIPAIGAAAPLESGEPLPLTSPSAILAEASTGTVVFEKNADEKREVASVTKLMTLLIVLEDLEAGTIKLEDSVTISKTAAAMPGSQALLDAGAAYPLETLLRSTIIASANDSAVALAEYIAGSEAAFVERMNQRAKELGMKDTCYVNCTGYPKEGQYTTARDVMKLSCQMSLHPAYHEYASIWMESLTHPSGRITDLTNTNRLVRFYEGCDGFKTGSTDAAKYCLSATAQRNGLRLIAIVLGTPQSQTRFNEARSMLDYGFANYQRVQVAKKGQQVGHTVQVKRGAAETVEAVLGNGLSLLLRTGQENQLTLEAELPDSVTAPIAAGDTLGTARLLLSGSVIAKIPLVAASSVPLPGFLEGLTRIRNAWR